jgi:hypothetical protein
MGVEHLIQADMKIHPSTQFQRFAQVSENSVADTAKEKAGPRGSAVARDIKGLPVLIQFNWRVPKARDISSTG